MKKNNNLEDCCSNEVVGVAITNSLFKIIHWSEAMTVLTGFREDESIHRDIWKLLLSDEMRTTASFRDLLASFLFEGGRGFSRLVTIFDKFGKQHQRCLYLNHVMLDNNDYWVISMRIVGGAHEDSVSKVDADYNRELINHIPAGVILINAKDGMIEDINIMASRLLGVAKDDLIGQSFIRYYYAKNNENQSPIYPAATMYNNEQLIYRADGNTLPVLKTIIPVKLNNKRFFLESFVDLSEQQKITKELIHAREVAELANRAKSDFLANMSHEIRTPMNPILGMTEFLLETDLTDQQRDIVMTVKEAASSLLTVINDILDFTKIESGKMQIEWVQFDVKSLIESTINIMLSKAREKELTLIYFVDERIPQNLFGDPTRIRQIIMNLLGNAIKFTMAGTVALRLNFMNFTGDGKVQLRIEIEDTGIGIDDEVIGRLFTPFMQAEGSTTRKFGGTGLGLSICKKLTELMHGQIGVDSIIGAGSTFWVELPFEYVYQQEEECDEKLGDLRIIIVDDSSLVRDVTSRYVTAWGLKNDQAVNGMEALALIRNAVQRGESYDVALVDWIMPEMDGMALAKAIRGDSELKNIRLVLLTSMHDNPEMERMAKDAGFNEVIIKPPHQSQLYNAIAATISGKRMKKENNKVGTSNTQQTNLGFHLLLAEDNLANQKLARLFLEKLGCKVDIAANGAEAVEMFIDCEDDFSYDAILMDCQMPVQNGFEATEIIRKFCSAGGNDGKQITIIAMTANAMEGDREKCLAAGMDDYISKPVSFAKLRDVLIKNLQVSD